MITNLVASVVISIVTNVMEQFPTRQVLGAIPRGPNGEVYAVAVWETVPVENPTNKTVITTCKEITVLKFDGWEHTFEKTLWSTSQVFALSTTWQPTTNAMTSQNWLDAFKFNRGIPGTNMFPGGLIVMTNVDAVR